jgi:hypothetical protein
VLSKLEIQRLLDGEANLKQRLLLTLAYSSERYTYVARGNVLNIQSPLEDMWYKVFRVISRNEI